jgi:hypothetical protein
MFENHFWSLGFQIKSAEEYKQLGLLSLNKGDVVARSSSLQYECWSLGNIELWLQTYEGAEQAASRIIDLSPHYIGSTRVRVVLKSRVIRERQSPLDHAYVAQVIGDGYPFAFDSPYVDADPEIPSEVTLQITAFAHELNVFDDESGYDQMRSGEGWATRSFVPCGMLEPAGARIEPPFSMAMFTGIVKSAAQEFNSYTGKSFQSAAVSSYSADYDIVVGPDVCERRLEVGNVVSGTFWMSGKFIEN